MKLLDCTLRDGGYYTNWDFPNELSQNYFIHIDKLPIDIIEIGYRSLPMKEYFGKYFYCPEFILKEAKRLAPNKRIAIMLNEKDTRPEDLSALLENIKEYVDIIRIAVDPARFDNAVILSKAIKNKGFKVALNLMYMSKVVKDPQIFAKLPAINGIVDYFSLVDSYGGVFPDEVTKAVKKVKEVVSMPVGFHGHNNLELALVNSLAALEAGAEIIDATVMGMGRGAGNLKTELLLTVLNSQKNLPVDFNELSELVTHFGKLHEEYEWGTNLPYMVSGANSLPQKDVMEWVGKRFYSFNSIIQALSNQKLGQKDNLQLPTFTPDTSKYSSVLIIGGGPSVMTHFDAICTFIKQHPNLCIIHASSKNARVFENINVDQFFCLVGNEGRRLETAIPDLKKFDIKAILPPYPRKMGTYVPDKLLSKAFELSEVNFSDCYKDSHTSLALQSAINLNLKQIYIAGYDGYSNKDISRREQELFIENEYLFHKVKEKGISITSITATQYNELLPKSVYSLIQ